LTSRPAQSDLTIHFSTYEHARAEFYTWAELQRALPYIAEQRRASPYRSCWDLSLARWTYIDDVHPSPDMDARAIQCRTPIHASRLDHFSRCYNLDALDIAYVGTGQDLVNISRIVPRLRLLSVHNSRLDCDDMSALSGFAELEELDVSHCKMDGGLGWLKYLKRLRCLNLTGARIATEDLCQLALCPELISVYLSLNDIDDIEPVSRISGIKELHLFGTGIADGCARYLIRLKEMNSLSIGGTDVSDTTVVELASHESLRQIGLSFTAISDVGVRALSQMAHLRLVGLRNTEVTRSALYELETAVPWCGIDMEHAW